MGTSSLTLSSQLKNKLKDIAKRSFDIVVALAGLIFLAPTYGLIALAIKRDTPGPAFYRGARIGRGGKLFNILKFRTMYEIPESYSGPKVTAHDDPRVTPLGRWLRDTKLNELPQLWNVLKGEMSLVGPRPEDPSLAKTWPVEVGKEILSVRPGITSPASVHYRDEETLLAYGLVLQKYMKELGPDKMRLDQLYVRHQSFWLDLDTILWTMLILLPKIGSYSPPEELLFVGPISRFIRQYMSWFMIDFFITFVAIGSSGAIWRAFGPLNIGWARAIAMAFGFAFLFSVSGMIFGVNRVSWSKATFADAYDLLPAWVFASVVSFIVNRYMGMFPSGLILIGAVLALCGFVFIRYRTRLILALLAWITRFRGSAQAARERVLVIGSGRTAEHIAWLLDHPTYSDKFQVVGYIDDNLLAHGTRIYGANVIGTYKDIPLVVEDQDIGVIIIADHHIEYEEYLSIISACNTTSTRIVVVPDIFGSLNGLMETIPSDPHDGIEVTDKSNFRCLHCLTRYAQANHVSHSEAQTAI